jgi:O-antigen/teichoic acid export membrane protein
MVRRFFRDSAIYVVPTILSSGMSFVMFPFYAHHFDPTQYGVFDLLTLTAMLVGWTVALEIYQGLGVYVGGEKNQRRVRQYASTALWFSVGAYALFGLLAELFVSPLSHALLGPGVELSLLRVAVPWMCISGLLAITQAQLRWQLRPVAFAIGSVINATVTIVASAVLVFGVGLGVEGAILGQLIAGASCLAYVFAATRGTFRLIFDWQKCKQMLSYSIPMVPSSIGVFLNLYADRLVIQHVRSLADLGLYGVGYRLATVVSLLLTAVQGAALPLILARKDEPSTPRELADVFRIFAVLGLSAFVAISLLATPALHVLADPRYQHSAAVVPFLLISVLFASMYSFAPGMAIKKKPIPMAAMTVMAGIANLVLALVLVPPLGILGAGIATAVTSFAWFVGLMVVSQRHYPVPHRWRQLGVAFAVAVALVAGSLALLPTSGSEAMDPSQLLVRCLLIAVGVALSARLVLGHREFAQLLRRLAEYSQKPRLRRASAGVS